MKTGNLPLAEQSLDRARDLAPNDCFLLNEMGVLRFKRHEYGLAEEAFRKALLACDMQIAEETEPIVFNLAHTCRKRRWVVFASWQVRRCIWPGGARTNALTRIVWVTETTKRHWFTTAAAAV